LGCPTRPIRNVGVAPPLAPPASIRDSPRPYVIRPLGQGSIFSSSRIAVRLRPCAEQYRSNVRSTQCRFWSRESGGHGTGALTKAGASVPPLSRLPREKVSRSAEHIFPIAFTGVGRRCEGRRPHTTSTQLATFQSVAFLFFAWFLGRGFDFAHHSPCHSWCRNRPHSEANRPTLTCQDTNSQH
jgi:hypothetical protein